MYQGNIYILLPHKSVCKAKSTVNLLSFKLAKIREEQQKLRNAMKAQELYQKGLDLGREGQYKEAVEAFTQAINLHPDFVEAYIYRAYDRTGTGDQHGGVKDFQKAMDIYRARGRSDIADMLLVPLNALQNEIKFEQEDQGQPEVEDEPKGK
jgi:tetratricopeptide (TPR) repeat protein